MRRTSPPPLHKCTPLWECAVSSTCITQHITPAHIHKNTQPQMCTHARTQSLPQQNRGFLGGFFFFSPFSQYSEPTDPPTCRRCPSSFTKASSSSSRQLAVLVFSPPKAALCVCGCGFGPGCWLWHTNLSHELYSDWRGFRCECVCVFVYWGHH